jgi:hypothetical protein
MSTAETNNIIPVASRAAHAKNAKGTPQSRCSQKVKRVRHPPSHIRAEQEQEHGQAKLKVVRQVIGLAELNVCRLESGTGSPAMRRTLRSHVRAAQLNQS